MQHRIKRWSFGWPRWWTFVFAIAITLLLGYVLTAGGMVRYVPVSLGLLFAVVLSAYVGGLWPGLLSTLIISAPLVLMGYRQVPLGAAAPIGPPGQLAWFPYVFGFMGSMISLLFEALHRSRRASDAAQRELAAILANTGDAIINTDTQGRIQYLNRTAVTVLQRELPDIIGRPFESVVQIHDANAAVLTASLVEQVCTAGHTQHLVSQQFLTRADGTRLAVTASASPVLDTEGRLASVVVTLRDCTEQYQVENMLREQLALRERLERIAAVVPGAIYEFCTHADGREQLLYASPAFKDIFGVDPAAYAEDAEALRNTLEPAEAADVRALTDAAARQLSPINIEQRMLMPHRGYRWVSVTAIPSKAADGSIHWFGIFTDVTERKRTGEQMRASQLQLQAALDAGSMGVFTANMESGTLEMDATARQLWGLDAVTEPVLTFAHVTQVLHPDDRLTAEEDYRQMLANGGLDSREYRLTQPDGSERWVACRGRAYRDEVSGHMRGAGVIMDITQNRRLVELRLNSQKLEALRVLAGGIAHDFNNLLLMIAGNTQLLLSDLPDHSAARTGLLEIDKAASRATELVRRILNFSSVNEFTRTTQVVALKPLIDAVVNNTRASLPAGVTVSASVSGTLPEVLAEAGQIQQALTSLLANAADASSATTGVIQVTAAVVDVDASWQQLQLQRGRYVCVSVTDNGAGIEPAVLPRIFDPFFTTKPAGRGTGLGLAIVHGIMKSLDGAVTVRSAPGQGATFALYVPVCEQQVTVPAESPATRGAAHILYVDDEDALVFLMSRTLERMGHRVTACDSPEQALQSFLAHPDDFDLVVSDMAMPVLTGIELAERILAVRPQLPFIITSGFVDAADAERARRVGVRRMIMKPNTVEELSLVVAAVLRDQVNAAPAS